MRTRTIPAAIGAALLLALTACGTGTDTTAETASSPPATSRPSPSKQYDVHDCRALLERNYEADNVYDATGDPECADLTRDEYSEVVGTVIKGRKDEIIEDSVNETAWDIAWDATDKDQQTVVCDRLDIDGAVVVGQEMMDDAAEPSGDEIEMVQYFLDNKC
ncbi:hypothetical protein [Streptomyces microflavus]|uniref:hypothetical protein n=1 Tax=Streptomyces microflavus TaxID=1919 RepID=UPI0038666F32|nr:hypothetical protein OG269_25820 [Streptomyces microflavus]